MQRSIMDWAYVAGYFDGEGHVNFKAYPSRPHYPMIYLSWANTHRASLEAMQAFMACGILRSATKKEGYKQGYELSISRVEDILRVGHAMLPHLLIKQDALAEMLAWAQNSRKSSPETWGLLTKIGPDEITRLYYEEGLTQRQIAERLGVSDSGVSTFFLRNGIKGRRRGPQEGAYGVLAAYGYEKIHAMFEDGMTMGDIAAEVGVQAKTVYMHFYTRGIRLTKRIRRARAIRNGRVTSEEGVVPESPRLFKAFVGITDEQLRQWYYDEGKSYAALGALLGVSATAVANEMKRRAIPARPVGGALLKGTTKSSETIAKMKASHAKLWDDPAYADRMRTQLATSRQAKRHTITAGNG
jgi:DNA-binding CsgD family transcriptional regulator